MEELDAENEYFFDEADSTLYLYYNATAGTPPPADLVVEATDLQDYIQVLGHGLSSHSMALITSDCG